MIGVVRENWREIWSSDIGLERRFANLEKGQEKLLTMAQNLDSNLKLYREDSKEFMIHGEEANEKFHQEMKENFNQFSKAINNKIDERFEKIDQRFEKIDQHFIEVHKTITRMTVFFVSGIGVIALLAKLVNR